MSNCIICGKPLDYEPQYCCDGKDCGCMGGPVEPPVCSTACLDACIDYIGLPFDERRQKAGIELYARTLPSEVRG